MLGASSGALDSSWPANRRMGFVCSLVSLCWLLQMAALVEEMHVYYSSLLALALAYVLLVSPAPWVPF